ncbi:hypothetical protein SK128_016621 [Halocaridina rubra]|uniref:Uncharacterized protein n=1 Tax=Halocaridina rubra TaxID=373956 RepID=A0AAN8XIU3_HALRR
MGRKWNIMFLLFVCVQFVLVIGQNTRTTFQTEMITTGPEMNTNIYPDASMVSESFAMCNNDGWMYYDGQTFYKDCKQYMCLNGGTIETGGLYEYCCYYNWYSVMDFGYIYSYYFDNYLRLNESVTGPNCTQQVCVGPDTFTSTQLNASECHTCEYNGYLYVASSRRYFDDCYEYICENGTWELTNNTHENCCWLNYYDYNWSDYYYSYGYYGLHAIISRYNCSDLICTSRNNWESEDCKMCDYDRQQYQHRETLMHDNCRQYLCENGEWIPTGITKKECCYYSYYDSYLDWGSYDNEYDAVGKYYGLNETAPTPNCTERACIDSGTWGDVRPADPEDCNTCEYGGYLYRGNSWTFKNDCMEYICQKGNWTLGNKTDDQCCYYNDYWYWNYYYYYNEYQGGYYGLGEAVNRYNCSDLYCTAKNTWESEDCKLCKYEDNWYHPTETIYKDDCIEHTCDNGEWIPTSNTDDYCCYYGWNLYHDDWNNADLDYDYGGIRDYTYEWRTLNGTVPTPNCTERVCVARETWEVRALEPEECITSQLKIKPVFLQACVAICPAYLHHPKNGPKLKAKDLRVVRRAVLSLGNTTGTPHKLQTSASHCLPLTNI